MTQIRRGNTLKFLFQHVVAGVPQNLNGFKVWFVIKHQKDVVANDTNALVTDYAAITTNVTEKMFTLTAEQSQLPPGYYVQGFRYETPSGGGSFTSDVDFEIIPTATNRLTPPA